MSTLCIGLISGTSADGIDAALVRFEDDGELEVLATLTHPYPAELHESVRSAIVDRQGGYRELMALDAACGDAFGAAALAVVAAGGIDISAISIIGSHGQTLAHHPEDGTTLQVADPNRIAARTGVPVAADFRRADMACGGQGAPLAPLLHRRLFAEDGALTGVVNLGGIANLTLLEADGGVRGFDTGPANTLLDGWANRHGIGERDTGGAFAATGTVNDALLARLLDDGYFRRAPPKSTGREYFNMAWLDARLEGVDIAPADVQATLVALTAKTIADQAGGVERLYVCGGGVHNTALMNALADALTGCTIADTGTVGIDPDAIEATLFAWLAWQRIHAQAPNGIRAVTGAARRAVLGGVWLPPGD